MNHLLAVTNPALYLGVLAFRANRTDTYEALLGKLTNTSKQAIETLGAIFDVWARRDAERKEVRAVVFQSIHQKLADGESLANALRPFIDNDEFLILSSGEIRGELPRALELAIKSRGSMREASEAVVTAMATPVVGALSWLFSTALFGAILWPDLLRSIPQKYWSPWAIQGVKMHIFIGAHWPYLFLLVGLVALYFWTLTSWTGRSRNWIDHVPPWSIYKSRQAAALLGVLAALVSSGRTVRESFVLVEGISSRYMSWHLQHIIRRYDAAGDDGMAALRSGLFSQGIMDRIEDAAANNTFDETLRYVGDRAMTMITTAVKQQAATASVVFLGIVGVLFVHSTLLIVVGLQEATDRLVLMAGQ